MQTAERHRGAMHTKQCVFHTHCFIKPHTANYTQLIPATNRKHTHPLVGNYRQPRPSALLSAAVMPPHNSAESTPVNSAESAAFSSVQHLVKH
jgi:hypothetical protein